MLKNRNFTFYIYHLLLIVIIYSCQQKKLSAVEETEITLIEDLTIDFEDYPLMDEQSFWTFGNNHFYYTYLFSDSLGIYDYNLESQKWTPYYFDLEGPNGIKTSGSIAAINDTLLVKNIPGQFTFQLIDLKNRNIQQYHFRNQLHNISDLTPQSVYYDGQIIGLPIRKFVPSSDPDFTSESPIYGIYNLNLKQLENFIPFPEEFRGETYSLNFLKHTFLVIDDEIFVNFQKSHYIHIYDLKGNLLNKQLVKSEGIQTKNPGREGDPFRDMIKSEFSGTYKNLIFDGRFFYRTALNYPAAEKSTPISSQEIALVSNSSRFKIIKCDRNLNPIASGHYAGSPTKKGIGDGQFFIFQGEPYFWHFTSPDEEIENFVSISFQSKLD